MALHSGPHLPCCNVYCPRLMPLDARALYCTACCACDAAMPALRLTYGAGAQLRKGLEGEGGGRG